MTSVQLDLESGEGRYPASIEDRYYLFALLGAFANRMQAFGDTVFEEVTWKQWFVLLGTSVFAGAPSVSEIAGFVGTSHQNVKQLLLRLQSIGMIRLEKDPKDQRRTLAHLTDKAEAFERKYRKHSMQFMDDLFKDISPDDLAVARQVLHRMDENLRTLAISDRAGGNNS